MIIRLDFTICWCHIMQGIPSLPERTFPQ
uniref:Uncharacterized protein n=1 Tax=Anguilla anguilla TaxID=7936 RepID=A0A0E9SXP5_ANGAN